MERESVQARALERRRRARDAVRLVCVEQGGERRRGAEAREEGAEEGGVFEGECGALGAVGL